MHPWVTTALCTQPEMPEKSASPRKGEPVNLYRAENNFPCALAFLTPMQGIYTHTHVCIHIYEYTYKLKFFYQVLIKLNFSN